MRYYAGKNVVITGASSGIGKRLAERICELGGNVLLIARNKDRLNEVHSRLVASYPDRVVRCAICDITDYDAVDRFATDYQSFKIDMLINNAGIPSCDSFENISMQQFETILGCNFLGHVAMTRALLPQLRVRKSHIVNITSLAGLFGIVGYTAYSPSKAAMIGFNDALRNELAGTDAIVTNIVPSDVETPFVIEENRSKPEACKAVAGLVKPMSVEAAVERMLSGIARRKSEVLVVPLSSRVTVLLSRVFPGIFRIIVDRMARKSTLPEKQASQKGTPKDGLSKYR